MGAVFKQTLSKKESVAIGDTNAMNFELLLSPEYYLATMSLYEEIKRNNIKPLNLLQTFDNDISLNEVIYYKN